MDTVMGKCSFLMLVFLLLSIGCAPGLPPGLPVPTATSPWEGAVPIGELLAHPDAYLGREVVVVAYYRGWDLFGEVGHGPPLTRSDVAVADATGAIYIAPAGPEAIPSFLRPSNRADADTLLRLRGKVERNERGLLYLRVIEGEAVEGLPTGVLLRIRRSGGIAGFDQEVMVTEQGTVYFLDRRLRRHTRFSVDPDEASNIARDLRSLSKDGGVYGVPVADGFSYEVSFWEGGKVRALTLYEPSAEKLPEVAERALEAIGQWIAEGTESLAGPVGAAVDALAERLGIPREEVEVVSYDPEPQNWPDASMGCPEPGQVYAQMVTSGYRVFLRARGQSYEVHVDQTGTQVVFCR